MSQIELSIQTVIAAPPPEVWRCYTEVAHVQAWCKPHERMRCPMLRADLRPGGRIDGRLEALDGSYAVPFGGVVQAVQPPRRVAFALDHGVGVETRIIPQEKGTLVTTVFHVDPEIEIGMQRTLWQGVLDSFRDYVNARAAGG